MEPPFKLGLLPFVVPLLGIQKVGWTSALSIMESGEQGARQPSWGVLSLPRDRARRKKPVTSRYGVRTPINFHAARAFVLFRHQVEPNGIVGDANMGDLHRVEPEPLQLPLDQINHLRKPSFGRHCLAKVVIKGALSREAMIGVSHFVPPFICVEKE